MNSDPSKKQPEEPAGPKEERRREDRRSWDNNEPPPYKTPEGWVWEDRRKTAERRMPRVEELPADTDDAKGDSEE